jgi:homoserine dehydrogenase
MYVGLLGAGVVGSGVARILKEKREAYAHQLGQPLDLKAALVRNLDAERPAVDRALLTTNADEILDDPEIAIVVEVMGVEQPALDYIERALRSGKYVVTANKEVMAKHGSNLLALARANNVDIFYEASVAGGIPIIAPLQRDLIANRVLSIAAIINGTTNYILTAMSRDGADFADALKDAQRLGFAEPDPTNDVEGIDACYKLAILASLAFHTRVRPEDVHREGITRIAARDFQYASEFGYAIKLLALAGAVEGGIQARVHPTLIDRDAPLAKVDGVLNAVQIEGDLTGHVMFQGRGAGSLPTTSAVIADILDAAQSILGGRREMPEPVEAPARIVPIGELRTRYYIRLTVADHPGVLARIAAILGEASISISSVIQKEANEDARTAEIVIMTHEANESAMREALTALEKLPVVQEIGNFLRVEEP